MNRLNQLLAISTAALAISCGAQNENYNDEYYGDDSYYGEDSYYAGESTYSNQQPAQNVSTHSAGSSQNALMDTQHGMPAYTFELPAGYSVHGQVYWANQAGIFAPNQQGRISNPSSGANIELMPSTMFKYLSGPDYDMYVQQMGIQNIAPMPTGQAMQRIVMGTIQQMHGNIQVTNSQPIENLEQQFWPGQGNPQMPTSGHMIAYTYQKGGTTYQAELYSVRYIMQQQIQGMSGMNSYTLWGLGRVIEISAPANEFAAKKGEMINIVKSIKKNPQWAQLVKQIDAQKAREIDSRSRSSYAAHQQRMANNQAAFDATQRAHRETQQAYDHANQSWMNNQRMSDQGQQNYVNSIHGTEVYTDPNNGDQYNLDNPYKYNWTNGNGEVISTDDAFYNPERYNSGTYYQLDPK